MKKVFTPCGIFSGLDFNYALPYPYHYLIFPVLGYLIANTDFNKWQRALIYVLSLFGAVFRYIETYRLSTALGSIDKTYFSYLQFHSVLLACGVFLLFKQINWDKIFKSDKSKKYVSLVSSCSFGIYLIHKIIMRVLTSEHIGINDGCWQWRLFAPLVIYLIALIGVMIMKKIPIVKRLVP